MLITGFSVSLTYWGFLLNSEVSFSLQEKLLEVGNTRSLSGTTPSKFWPTSILGDALQVVFQNLLLESNDEILQSSERAWKLLLQVIFGHCLFTKCTSLAIWSSIQ
jgi:hypothetical protein